MFYILTTFLGIKTTHCYSIDVPEISDEAISNLEKELEVEERIMEAAQRIYELPSNSKKEKQIRKKSLQQWVTTCMLLLRLMLKTLMALQVCWPVYGTIGSVVGQQVGGL